MKCHDPVRNVAKCQERKDYPCGLCLRTEKYRSLVVVSIGTSGHPLMRRPICM